MTLPLHRVGDDDRRLVGGKAVNLGVLMRTKLPVPPGFCVTTVAFNWFLDSWPDRADFLEALSSPSAGSPDSTPNLSDSVRACLAKIPIPPQVGQAVVTAWRKYGEERAYAVRSSATVEDATGHSFAGQFESYLNIRGQEALLGAIKRCWLSLFSERALAYHAREQLPIDKTAMAVVVQEMIPAEAAGVVFTLDPVTGDNERIVIEGASGLGDRLVSGKIAPDRVVLRKPSLRVVRRQLASGSPCLDDTLSRRLGKLALKTERLFRGPTDIEWAAVGRQVFLLQARPATGAPTARSWEDRQIWSNVNTGEVLPDVMTPMTWSVIQLFLAPLFRSVFGLFGADADRAPVAGLVAGRAYFNANTGLAAAKPFWFLMSGLPNFAQALGGGHASEYYRELLEIPDTDLPDVGFRWPKYILSWPRIVRNLIRHSPRRGDAWTARLKTQTAELVGVNLEVMSTPDLIALLERLLSTQFEGWDLLYLGTQAAALPLFQKACRDWLDDPRLTLGYRLFPGLGGIPEVEAGLALWRLAMLAHADAMTEAVMRSEVNWSKLCSRLGQTEHGRQFLEAWTDFMVEHGHHCRGEIELSNARWSETPDYILGLIRAYLDANGQLNPPAKQQRLAEERLRLTEQCRRRLRNPIKRRLFSTALGRAQKLAVSREVWKDLAVRQLVVLRRGLLILGQRLHEQGTLDAPDDIFFLEVSEVRPVSTGKANFNPRERIRSRRLEYETNLKLSPPPVVVGKFRPGIATAPSPKPDAGMKVLEGIPVSPGVVTGPARVILRTNNHEQILPGEILVAPFTDPAWTPYFVTAAGVIIEQGGILSHGSIVAREFGLPAVTNLDGATDLLRTGDLVELDGNLGRVTILERTTTAAPQVLKHCPTDSKRPTDSFPAGSDVP